MGLLYAKIVKFSGAAPRTPPGGLTAPPRPPAENSRFARNGSLTLASLADARSHQSPKILDPPLLYEENGGSPHKPNKHLKEELTLKN